MKYRGFNVVARQVWVESGKDLDTDEAERLVVNYLSKLPDSGDLSMGIVSRVSWAGRSCGEVFETYQDSTDQTDNCRFMHEAELKAYNDWLDAEHEAEKEIYKEWAEPPYGKYITFSCEPLKDANHVG